jgi:hypothetical protein
VITGQAGQELDMRGTKPKKALLLAALVTFVLVSGGLVLALSLNEALGEGAAAQWQRFRGDMAGLPEGAQLLFVGAVLFVLAAVVRRHV